MGTGKCSAPHPAIASQRNRASTIPNNVSGHHDGSCNAIRSEDNPETDPSDIRIRNLKLSPTPTWRIGLVGFVQPIKGLASDPTSLRVSKSYIRTVCLPLISGFEFFGVHTMEQFVVSEARVIRFTLSSYQTSPSRRTSIRSCGEKKEET